MKGFREGSKIASKWLEENTTRVVSREARAFIYAGFFGALAGTFAGVVFSFGVGAFFF